MHTPCSSLASVADDAGSLLQEAVPRTAARHLYGRSSLTPTPVDSKATTRSYGKSPQSLRNGVYEAEGLCKTGPQSLLPTFARADRADVDVSARLELEFSSAAQSTGWSGSTCRSLPDKMHRAEGFAAADKMLPCNSGHCCPADVAELTQVFKEPLKTPCTPRTPPPMTEENRQGPDGAEDIQNPTSAPSPHTPLENIVRFHSPHWSPILATPQKSARPPTSRFWTPLTHRRVLSSLSFGAESREACGLLPHITQADHLPPNRNPCSPYREYADEMQLLLQQHPAKDWDGGVVPTTNGMLRRVDACVVALEQTAPGASAECTEGRWSSCCLPAGEAGEAVSASSSVASREEEEEEEESLDLSCILLEPKDAERGSAWPAAEAGASIAAHAPEDNYGLPDDAAALRSVWPEACQTSPEKTREGVWDAPTHHSVESQPSSGLMPKTLLETRNFDELCNREWGRSSSLPLATGLADSTARCAPAAGVHAAWMTAKEDGTPVLHPTFFSSSSVRVDSQNFCSTDRSGQMLHHLRSCNESPMKLSSIGDCTLLEPAMSEEDEEDEAEPGDRFRSHHRYQFLHWLAWRKAYDFLPIHVERNGVSWLVTHRVDGLPYVVKEIPCSHKGALQWELECLTLGNAPVNALQQQAADHIARYFTVAPYRVVACDSQDCMAFLLQTEYFPMGNVMEWALDPHRIRGKDFHVPPEDFWSCVLQHGLLAMESLHAAHIIHGNPLPFNVFIHSPRHYKLGSFGAAVKFPSTYPVGSANVFLPAHTEEGAERTPYEVDVFLFVRGVLQLLHHCINQRKAATQTHQPRDDDGEETLSKLFLTDATVLSLADFQADRVQGYHAISDHLWSVLQAALHGDPISTLLRMLDAPSRPQWALRSLFSLEESYLLRRRRRLEQLLEKRFRERPQTAQQCESPRLQPASSPEDLATEPEWCAQGHAAPRSPEVQGGCHTFAFPLPLAPRASAAQGLCVSVSPTRGKTQSTPHRVEWHSRCCQRLASQPSRQHGEAQLSSLETSAESFLLLRSCASRGMGLFQENSFLFRNPLVADVETASTTKSAHSGHPPDVSGRMEDKTPSPCPSRLDANLSWTVRQIMAVMNWEDALKGVAARGTGSTPVRDSSPSTRGVVRPLTSWERRGPGSCEVSMRAQHEV
ncbi:transferase [Trypanosoma conorhini]|uniref:Transferase n=1 Tax=Trypanosoma conorhini TaxID=83891 RepID=A0A3R7LPY8_9TRYP|nr:transferase [Trypanosoma conorhini]RNF18541.1 transferase [Trypanosoma conorhini]